EEWSTMLTKLSALVSSKAALAALGGALLLGGAGTVAAAETGHLPAGASIPGISHPDHDHNGDQSSNGTSGRNGDKSGGTDCPHAHTVPIHGTLAAAGAHSISVKGKAEDQDNGGGTGEDKGTPSPTCGLKSPFTIALTGETMVNGQAKAAADLAKHIG